MTNDRDALVSRATPPPWALALAQQNDVSDQDVPVTALAREFGVTPRALRFYERKGLLSPRRQGSARRYGPAERARLAAILQAKRMGFTLLEIRRLLGAKAGRGPAAALNIDRRQCIDQIRLLEERKREIEIALAELRRTYSSLHEAAAAG